MNAVIYHWKCDEIDDRGWGCAYRSFQSAASRLGYTISMRQMVDFYGIQQVEPAMMHPFIPSGVEPKTYLWLKTPGGKENMKSTTPQQYTYRLRHTLGILRLLMEHTLVINNGVFVYCLYRDEHGYFLLDPRTTDPRKVRRKLPDVSAFLDHVNCWMILALKVRSI